MSTLSNISKMALLIGVLTVGIYPTFADRGVGKKAKTKITLNIKPTGTFKNNLSFNLKSGLTYTGSLLSNTRTTGNSISYNTLVTYQKGNTIYIVPYKQKLVVPEVRQGYTGMKLIIKHN
ncbi:MAG: hypothetical protein JWQ27_859 [Ferruginibacter sp.]|nr:hypothetical protein [Ferruginibacter sp.]